MPTLPISEEQLARFCRKQHIRRLSLFGSTLAGTARPDSDIDLLVEFEPDCESALLGLASMEAELGALLGGNKVDLRTPQDLSRHFRDQVLRTAEVQFERPSREDLLARLRSRPSVEPGEPVDAAVLAERQGR
jgi:predicted nucleotidyltransferase